MKNPTLNPALVIAEIGTSHGGSLEKAERLIDAAVDAGADAVKFQWVYADEILHPDTGFVDLPGGKVRLYDRFKALETDESFFRHCLDYARSKNAKFICSPFGLKSLEKLLKICPDYIKIASPELNHFPLLKATAKNRGDIPVIVSTGVSRLEDIEEALGILGTDKVTLLHCITCYPAPEEEYNLRLVKTLSQKFSVDCGISDHSLDPVLVPCLAVSQGAKIIEKHITLSRETDGLDDPVALTPEQFALMCHTVRQSKAVLRHYGNQKGEAEIIRQMEETAGKQRVERILGTGIKTLAPSEKENYGRTNRSLHFLQDMKAGQIITENSVAVLRTEKILTPGISPRFLEAVQGKTLVRDVKAGEGVLFEDFENFEQAIKNN